MVSAAFVVAGLTTGHKIGLGVVGLAFIGFALVCSFVLPARNPNFPGKHVGWFVAVCVLFFVAMISAVLIFGVEKKENTANAGNPSRTETQSNSLPGQTTSTPATTATTPAAPAGGQGDPAAGKAVFASAGCGGCHTLKAAGSSGNVGPNLDQLKPAAAVVAHQVEVGGGPMPSFKASLSAKQIKDVAAFVATSTHS
jgi:mono/diheme cytochrome c family protein